jgi:hypothetical protein
MTTKGRSPLADFGRRRCIVENGRTGVSVVVDRLIGRRAFRKPSAEEELPAHVPSRGRTAGSA